MTCYTISYSSRKCLLGLSLNFTFVSSYFFPKVIDWQKTRNLLQCKPSTVQDGTQHRQLKYRSIFCFRVWRVFVIHIKINNKPKARQKPVDDVLNIHQLIFMSKSVESGDQLSIVAKMVINFWRLSELTKIFLFLLRSAS